ncbi:MAG: ABC transporter ATP-binding protein [Candidatus Tectimicrobiota bacterium]|nr:MAG: ABC transporter ATP-binding protein [Candidatus Tectomicrobia bacterium]
MVVLEHVSKRFGARLALDDVCLCLGQGRTHVLLGSSGCGKTTLLRLVLGLEQPDGGAVYVGGTRVEAATCRALRRQMGYVVQEGGLYPHLTAARNVTLPAEAQRWPRPRIAARLHELAALVDLDLATLQRYPQQLSGGQRQRVGLMRALMLDPPLLLLDEPLAALDPLVRAELQAQLRAIFTTLGKTVLLVTHDLREAALLGDTVTLMHAGRVVQHGTLADLVERPATPFVTAFLQAQALPPVLEKGRLAPAAGAEESP